MARLLVQGFSISLDGYGAGPRQSRENPLGVGGEDLHDWLVHTRTFKRLHDGGEGRCITSSREPRPLGGLVNGGLLAATRRRLWIRKR